MFTMESLILLAFLLLFPILLFLIRRNPSKRLPPGSMGLPLIGQSISLLRAMRTNKAEEWLQKRIRKYGSISKLSLFGKPTIFLHGQAANKFIYTCDANLLANQQPSSIRRLIGERNLLELRGDDYRRIKGALASFLKLEVLKQYVAKIDDEIRAHLKEHWIGKQEIMVMQAMKTLTFDVICSIIFGIEKGERRHQLIELFKTLMDGMLAVPLNLPFTRFRKSLQANTKIKAIIMKLIEEKREMLAKGCASPDQDLISSMLSISGEDNSPLISDAEIVDNVVIVMLAGYDTTSILLTFLIKLLADDSSVYCSIKHEHEEIKKNKGRGELLTWDDLVRMKYTWRVAMETLRMNPPVFCSFRTALKDFEYEGHLIPKGWQVVWAASMTHMDENIFPDPSTFNPSRFEQGAAPPFSFVAFGGGPRMCPGYEFARLETMIMIHYLVTSFCWKCSSKDNNYCRDPMPVFKNGLPIEIQQKEAARAL